MQADDVDRAFGGGGARCTAACSCVVAALAALSFLAPTAYGQDDQAAGAREQARVPTSYANVHGEPSSGAVLLLLVPEGTVLPVIGRRGEWVQVRLSPELRETGMVVRWYEGRHEIIRRGERITIGDEDNGWMHDSTVEITAAP